MREQQKRAKEFMEKAGQVVRDKPSAATQEERLLRVKLIAEELTELAESLGVIVRIDCAHFVSVEPFGQIDLVEAYDALLDLDYVTIGAGCTFGFDMEPGQDEVHRSNMSKFIDGHRRADGKWVKGPSYSPADLFKVLSLQLIS